MFHDLPKPLFERMKYLESMDTKDRQDGTTHPKRLRQIPPETGKFIALLAALAPDGYLLEIGTSAGYSTLWLALACREQNRHVTTFEVLEDKQKLAKETFKQARVEDFVKLISGDAKDYLSDYEDIAFCFLDAEKNLYLDFYELIIPRLKKGGILIADNVISHQAALQPMLDRALSDDRVDALVVPIGKGELVCRKL